MYDIHKVNKREKEKKKQVGKNGRKMTEKEDRKDGEKNVFLIANQK